MQRAKYLIIFCLSHFLTLTYAQDIGNFTQFFFNPYSLNPSFAGIDGRSALFAAYRKQWSGIEGGPTLSNFSFHTPLKSGLNLGFNVANDKRGILSNSGALITLGYSISLGEDKYIRFGLSGGGSWNTIDLSKINSQTIASDPALINLLNKNASVIGNAGVSLHVKSFHVGFALPNLFAPSYVSKDAFTVTEIKPLQAFVVHASNRFYFAKNKHVFEPYVVYRNNQSLPSQLEAAAVVHLNHIVWFGGSWKQEFGFSALGGLKLNNMFAVGGSYTLKSTGENQLSYPTYEIHLSLLGGASKNKGKSKITSKTTTSHAAPYYSFIHTELPKKTRADLIHDNYVAAIAKADKALAAKNYEEARIDYYEAQKYKPSETYPKTKIEEVGKIITYENDIKKANTEFSSKSYEKALADYEAASNLSPNEKYPKEKIAEIKAMMAKEGDAKESERKYKEEIAKADAAFKAKDYVNAEAYYKNAEAIRPKEVYPQVEIAEIERLLAEKNAVKPAKVIPQEPIKETPKVPDQKVVEEPLVVIEPIKEQPKDPVERHEFIKKGGHVQELEISNYVIVGVFGSVANAKSMAKRLVDTGFNANYGFLTEKNLWYVHIFSGDDVNNVRAQRDKFRKQPIFSHAWLLTVHN